MHRQLALRPNFVLDDSERQRIRTLLENVLKESPHRFPTSGEVIEQLIFIYSHQIPECYFRGVGAAVLDLRMRIALLNDLPMPPNPQMMMVMHRPIQLGQRSRRVSGLRPRHHVGPSQMSSVRPSDPNNSHMQHSSRRIIGNQMRSPLPCPQSYAQQSVMQTPSRFQQHQPQFRIPQDRHPSAHIRSIGGISQGSMGQPFNWDDPVLAPALQTIRRLRSVFERPVDHELVLMPPTPQKVQAMRRMHGHSNLNNPNPLAPQRFGGVSEHPNQHGASSMPPPRAVQAVGNVHSHPNHHGVSSMPSQGAAQAVRNIHEHLKLQRVSSVPSQWTVQAVGFVRGHPDNPEVSLMPPPRGVQGTGSIHRHPNLQRVSLMNPPGVVQTVASVHGHPNNPEASLKPPPQGLQVVGNVHGHLNHQGVSPMPPPGAVQAVASVPGRLDNSAVSLMPTPRVIQAVGNVHHHRNQQRVSSMPSPGVVQANPGVPGHLVNSEVSMMPPPWGLQAVANIHGYSSHQGGSSVPHPQALQPVASVHRNPGNLEASLVPPQRDVQAVGSIHPPPSNLEILLESPSMRLLHAIGRTREDQDNPEDLSKAPRHPGNPEASPTPTPLQILRAIGRAREHPDSPVVSSMPPSQDLQAVGIGTMHPDNHEVSEESSSLQTMQAIECANELLDDPEISSMPPSQQALEAIGGAREHPGNLEAASMSPAVQTPMNALLNVKVEVSDPSANPNLEPAPFNEGRLRTEKWEHLQTYIEPLSRLINQSESEGKGVNGMKRLLAVLMDSSEELSMSAIDGCQNALEYLFPLDCLIDQNQEEPQEFECRQFDEFVAPYLEPPLNLMDEDYSIPDEICSEQLQMHGETGNEINGSPVSVPDNVQREINSLEPKFKITVDLPLSNNTGTLHLVCQLAGSTKFPPVPPIRVLVPDTYPEEGPKWRSWDWDTQSDSGIQDQTCDDSETPCPTFLEGLKQNMEMCIKNIYDGTITGILRACEMSVRKTSKDMRMDE